MEPTSVHSSAPSAGGPAPATPGEAGGRGAGDGAARLAEQGRAPARPLKEGADNHETAQGGDAPSRARVQKAVEEANAALRHLDFHLEMSVERGRDEVVTRVVNDQTGKVVRTIPREDVLDMARSLQETGGGALLDTRG